MFSEIGILYSLIAGILSILLIFYALRKKSEEFFVFSLVFLLISWSGIEWSLWTQGYNLFELLAEPIVPLLSYFVGWGVFVIYLSEKYFKRRDWIAFLIIVLVIIGIASVCMDCL